jgi:hypothetical protein
VRKLEVIKDMDSAAEKIWSLLTDFGDIQKWWPVQLEAVDIEGDGIGMVRHMHTTGIPDPVSERLDSLDHKNFAWSLSIINVMPAGMTRYKAWGQLIPTGPDSCRMEYRSEVEAEAGQEQGAVDFLLGAYDVMFQGLKEAARSM